MSSRFGLIAVAVGVLAVSTASVRAEITLEYAGAFRALPGNQSVYNCDVAYYAAGNGGAGSIFLSDIPVGAGKELYELNIPALKITTDINQLNLATLLHSYDLSLAPEGLAYRSTDGKLYYSSSATGSAAIKCRFINTDGTGESAERAAPAWQGGGFGMTQVPDDWAANYASGKNIVTVGGMYGIRLASIDPWNTPVSYTALVAYDSGHLMNGYDYNDGFSGVAWVSVAGESNFIVCGKDASAAAATLWFIRADDVAGAPNTYSPQPYKTLSIQDKLFVSTQLEGVTYDPVNQVIYGYEGAYIKPSVMHAWRVVDAPPTAITDLAAAPADWNKVELTWTAPSDDHGPEGAVASYDIRYSTETIDDSNWDAAVRVSGGPSPLVPGQVQTFVVGGLLGSTQYFFAVKGLDSNGHASALSNVAVATTNVTDAVPPAAIALTAHYAPYDYSMTWTAVGDDGVDGTATRYDIRYSTDPITEANWALATAFAGVPAPRVAGSEELFRVRGLAPSTTYYIAIKAADEVPNWSPLGNVVTLTTDPADVTPPTAVTNLRVRYAHIHSAFLTWPYPTDTQSGIGSFDLRYSTSPIDAGNFDAATPVAGIPADADCFTVSGLAPSTTYYFAIKSVDQADPPNVSGMSNVASGTTMPPVQPVTVHNPWISNDRVADCRTLDTMAGTFDKAYTPDGVTAPDPADIQTRAINEYNNFKRRLYHWGSMPPNNRDVVEQMNVFGWALCGSQAGMNSAILNAMGLHPRVISIASGGHTIWEINYNSAWHCLDTMTTYYVWSRTTPRYIVSMAEVKADKNLVYNAAAEGRACPGFLLCGDTPQYFADGSDSWQILGDPGNSPTTYSMNMDLRLGEGLKRTWESWAGQYTTASTTPPYHHESANDWKDTVNYPYWEPYKLDSAGNAAIGITYSATYRRWANGTLVLEPDFRSAGYQAAAASTLNIATFNDDGLTPDLHVAAAGSPGEIVFHIVTPFLITDAGIDGSFYRKTSADITRIYTSANGTAWAQAWDNSALGTTQVSGLNIKSAVTQKFEYWVKVMLQAGAGKTDAGVSGLRITTIFEHNKGGMAYLDKGVNHLTLSFDNGAELLASGNVIRVVYKWKEYDGAGWNTDRSFECTAATSPFNFTITTGGTKVPRTEYALIEVAEPPVPCGWPPAAITDLASPSHDATFVDLAWTAVGDACQGQAVAAYDLRYSSSPITADSWASATPAAGLPAPQAPGSPEFFTVAGLTPATDYYFAIRTRDGGGNVADLSNVIHVRTADPDVTPPGWVKDLAGRMSTTSHAVDLAWTATGDDGEAGTAASYQIRYSTSPIAWDDGGASWNAATPVAGVPAPQAAGSAESFTVSGLAPGTEYYFAVKAIDDFGNMGEISNITTGIASNLGEKVFQDGLGGYSGTVDNYMEASSPTVAYGDRERMRICGYADSDPANRQRALVRFDLSSLPAGTAITRATFSLYAYDEASRKGSTGFYAVHRLTRTWQEIGSCWNLAGSGTSWTTAGSDFEAAADATSPKQGVVNVWYPFDVTARVQTWIDSPAGNFGWCVRVDDENRHNQDLFYSSDSQNAPFRPRLVVSDMPAAIVGDVNCDGHVDVVDLLYLVDSFGWTLGQRGYDPRCDFNADQSVDVIDLLTMVETFGT